MLLMSSVKAEEFPKEDAPELAKRLRVRRYKWTCELFSWGNLLQLPFAVSRRRILSAIGNGSEFAWIRSRKKAREPIRLART
jgi:hypothetical protein